MNATVNMLCDVGDKVRLDTETGEFKERAGARWCRSRASTSVGDDREGVAE